MRVAALYDVHGNLPALEAVLAEVDAAGADAVVCGGDVAAGPFPRECLELLRSHDAVFVRGNADRDLSPWLSEQLPVPAQEFLAQLPHARLLDGILYCHGSPRSDDEILTRLTPRGRLAAALAGVKTELVVCGHTHVQFDLNVGRVRLVNAGSVGMPYEGRPGAFWAIVDGIAVEHRHTPYALEAAVVAIRSTGFPDADELCSTLLDPEGPEEASAYFESLAT